MCGDIKGLSIGVAGQSWGGTTPVTVVLVMTSLTLLRLSAICNNDDKYYFICVVEKHWPEQWLLYSVLETTGL